MILNTILGVGSYNIYSTDFRFIVHLYFASFNANRRSAIECVCVQCAAVQCMLSVLRSFVH